MRLLSGIWTHNSHNEAFSLLSHREGLKVGVYLSLIDILSQVIYTFPRLFSEFAHLFTLPFQQQL